MKLYLFDPEVGGKEIDIVGELEEYYNLIGCDVIDIVKRRIGDTWFDVICDDEGFLKSRVTPSAVDTSGMVMLVGKLIFSHHNKRGSTTKVTKADIKLIEDATVILSTPIYGAKRVVVLEY